MKKKLILTGIIFIVFFALVELLVRAFAPQDLISDIIIFDDDLCYKLKNNAEGIQNSREFKVKLTTNSIGIRDRSYSWEKGDDTFRILMLGDSHTFGWGVELDNTFTELIESRIKLINPFSKYEVFNCGVYGYGTTHQYMYLEKYGFDLKPDLVIIAMDLLHDIRVNKSGYYYFSQNKLKRSSKPHFTKKSRAITKYFPFSSFLRGHSHLFRFVGSNLSKLFRHDSIINEKRNDKGEQKQFFNLGLTYNIFLKISRELEQREVKFIVAILPEFDSFKQKSKSNPHFSNTLASLERFFLDNNFNYISLQKKFDNNSESSEFIFKFSHHFNAKGHQFIAEEIEDFLFTSGIL